eukprot:2604347-Pleurochrysis_carterae.AAC.2
MKEHFPCEDMQSEEAFGLGSSRVELPASTARRAPLLPVSLGAAGRLDRVFRACVAISAMRTRLTDRHACALFWQQLLGSKGEQCE